MGQVSKYWLEHPYHIYPQVTPPLHYLKYTNLLTSITGLPELYILTNSASKLEQGQTKKQTKNNKQTKKKNKKKKQKKKNSFHHENMHI